jgi:hypothetical protein
VKAAPGELSDVMIKTSSQPGAASLLPYTECATTEIGSRHQTVPLPEFGGQDARRTGLAVDDLGGNDGL